MTAFIVYLIGFVLVFIGVSIFELYELKKSRSHLKELKQNALFTASVAATLWPVLLIMGIIVLPFTLTFNLLDKIMDYFLTNPRD